jgi:hypothetical protein
LTYSFQLHYGPGFDSASNRNEYQEDSWGVKRGRRVRLTNVPRFFHLLDYNSSLPLSLTCRRLKGKGDSYTLELKKAASYWNGGQFRNDVSSPPIIYLTTGGGIFQLT